MVKLQKHIFSLTDKSCLPYHLYKLKQRMFEFLFDYNYSSLFILGMELKRKMEYHCGRRYEIYVSDCILKL